MRAGSKKPRVYLSGGMEYAKREGNAWRAEIETWIRSTLGHSVFNPTTESVRFLARNLPDGDFRALKTEDFPRYQRLVARIVDLDSREVVKNSSYVICLWDQSAQRGAGTKGELTLARYFRKPVYVVTRMHSGRIPGWVLGCTTQLFPSFHALKIFLAKKFHQDHEGGKR